MASYNGPSEVVDKLLDKGANIEAQDKVTCLISSQNLSITLFDIDVDFNVDVIDLSYLYKLYRCISQQSV